MHFVNDKERVLHNRRTICPGPKVAAALGLGQDSPASLSLQVWST